MSNESFKILNLSELDIRRIKASKKGCYCNEVKIENDSFNQNELGLIALVGGIGLISSVVSYLFGKHSKEEIELDIEESTAEGSCKRLKLKFYRSSNEPVESQVIKALNKLKTHE